MFLTCRRGPWVEGVGAAGCRGPSSCSGLRGSARVGLGAPLRVARSALPRFQWAPRSSRGPSVGHLERHEGTSLGQPIWPRSLRPAGSVGRRAGGPAAGLTQAPSVRLPSRWPSLHVLGCAEIHSLHSTGRRPSGWLGGPGARACSGAQTEGGVTWDRLRTPARAWGPNSVSWLKG